MSEAKSNGGISALWNLTNAIVLMAFLAIGGVFSYLAISARANAAEIGSVKIKTEVNTAVIGITREMLGKIEDKIDRVDQRLLRLEVHFNTLPEASW